MLDRSIELLELHVVLEEDLVLVFHVLRVQHRGELILAQVFLIASLYHRLLLKLTAQHQLENFERLVLSDGQIRYFIIV